MVRSTPPSDWVVYLVVFAVSLAMLLGKYLIAKGDEPIQDVIKEDLELLEEEIEKVEHFLDDNKKGAKK